MVLPTKEVVMFSYVVFTVVEYLQVAFSLVVMLRIVLLLVTVPVGECDRTTGGRLLFTVTQYVTLLVL